MSIDPLKDLVPVIQLSRQPVVLAVHPSLGVNSLAELIALAKEQPGHELCDLRRRLAAAIRRANGLRRSPASSSSTCPIAAAARRSTISSPATSRSASLGSSPLIPHYKAGTLRLLAQSTQARSPSLPDVPTYQEAGIKGLVLDQWLGVFVPAGTPPAIVARLNAEINKALGRAGGARQLPAVGAGAGRRQRRSSSRSSCATILRNTSGW